MIFTTLTTRINASLFKLLHQRFIQRSSEPLRFCACQFDAGKDRLVAKGDVLAYKSCRRLAPDGFVMNEASSASTVLIPCSYVGEMDIAKKDGIDITLLEIAQSLQEDSFKVLRSIRIGKQRDTQGSGLSLDEGNRHAVETDALTGLIVHGQQVLNVHSCLECAIKSKDRIFASAEAQGAALFPWHAHVKAFAITTSWSLL